MGPEGSAPPDGAVPQTGAQPQQAKPSIGGALAGGLGGKFGIGKRKQEPQDAPQSGNAPPQQSQALLDMTTESSNFSTAGVDSAMFEVPAGFKEVKPNLKK
jgi:hypothetical protein